MKSNKTIQKHKKMITKNYIEYNNETLISMLNDGKKDDVINSLLPMVIYIVNKFYTDDFEELISVGNIGLLNGINKFNINKGGNLISYCHSCIRWSILNYFNEDKNLIRLPLSKNVSKKTLNSRPRTINIEDIDYLQLVDNNELYEEKTINREELEQLLMTIPKMKLYKVNLFLDYYLIPNITFNILCKKYNFSKQNCSLVVQEVLKKIKQNPIIMDKIREILIN